MYADCIYIGLMCVNVCLYVWLVFFIIINKYKNNMGKDLHLSPALKNLTVRDKSTWQYITVHDLSDNKEDKQKEAEVS